MLSQAEITSVPVKPWLMVKFRVTILSQPLAVWRVKVAVLLLEVYVIPSIQVMLSHEEITSSGD